MNTKTIIESTNATKATSAAYADAAAAAPFYAASVSTYLYSLFWSVFGPAAQYCFGQATYAYAASMKP